MNLREYVRNGRLRLPNWVKDHDLSELQLGDFSDVEEVELDRTQVTDAGLVHLKGLSTLKALELRQTRVSDAGLAHLKEFSNLEILILDNTQVTDEGLAHLKGLTNLKVLHIEHTQVTDDGLVHLKGLSGIEGLDLSGTQVSDEGLVHLKDLKALDSVSLNYTRVSDEGLMHLKDLKALDSVSLNNTRVTAEGISSLEGARPECAIDWGGYITPDELKNLVDVKLLRPMKEFALAQDSFLPGGLPGGNLGEGPLFDGVMFPKLVMLYKEVMPVTVELTVRLGEFVGDGSKPLEERRCATRLVEAIYLLVQISWILDPLCDEYQLPEVPPTEESCSKVPWPERKEFIEALQRVYFRAQEMVLK